MNKIEFRDATLDELDLIVKWRLKVLNEVFKDYSFNQKELEKSNYNYYEKALKEKTHKAIFVLSGNIIIGCGGICFYNELPSPDNLNGHCAYLMNIFIKKDFRGKGIASQLIKFLVKTAKISGASKIFLESTKEALPMYKKLGFKDLEDYLYYS